MRTVTLDQRPDLAPVLDRPDLNPVPEMLAYGAAVGRYWDSIAGRFPEHQVMALDGGRVVARGTVVPLLWEEPDEDLPDEGFDWALVQAMDDHAAGCTPNVACALLIGVAGDRQGEGLSTVVAEAMRENARAHGFEALLAPLRPTLKDRYPLIPMGDYAAWTREEDGAPFDPWLRVHWRLGARLLHPCERSMVVTGTVAEWERWTGMPMPGSGRYTVPGGLAPVEVDRSADTGRYVEPNVWARHDLAPA